MQSSRLSSKEWGERIVLAVLFVAIAGTIIIVFSPWGRPPVHRINDYLAKIGVSFLLLALALLARRHPYFEKFWQILFAIFILTVTISVERIFGNHVLTYLGVNDSIPSGLAMQKLNEGFVVVSVIVIFTLLSGGSLGSIYIQKGNLRLGLLIGGIAFLICIAGSIPTAGFLFKAQGLTVARVLPWIPWVLIYVLVNGALEELMFRGLFLRKLEPFFGKLVSNILIGLVFTVLHNGAFYTSDQYLFLAITFPAALAWGYTMQKTDSIWGSILFHAGMDIPIVLGIFSQL